MRLETHQSRRLSAPFRAQSRRNLDSFRTAKPRKAFPRDVTKELTATSLEGYGCPNFPTMANNNGVCNEDFVNDTRDGCCKLELGIIYGGLSVDIH